MSFNTSVAAEHHLEPPKIKSTLYRKYLPLLGLVGCILLLTFGASSGANLSEEDPKRDLASVGMMYEKTPIPLEERKKMISARLTTEAPLINGEELSIPPEDEPMAQQETAQEEQHLQSKEDPRARSTWFKGSPDGANRAPPRVHSKLNIHLGERKTAKLSSAEVSGLQCYVENGYPTGVPNFLPPLLEALGTSDPESGSVNYAAAAGNASDEWTVLIGWIPGRFMPPQKAGKDARGNTIEAPTRGKNNDVYLKEYNSTWHTDILLDGKEWHFQLVHRNAIRVCIRERLHLYEIYCLKGQSSNGDEATQRPLRIYYCPCRHCEKTTPKILHKTSGGKREVVPAILKTKPLKIPAQPTKDGLQLRPFSKSKVSESGEAAPCTSARSAPWIVPKSVVPRFSYEGLHPSGKLDELLKVQADENNIVIVTMFNKFWIDHLHNWVYSLGTYGKAYNFIVATMDDDSLEVCRANRLPCFDATEYAELDKADFKSKVSEAQSWIKPRLAVAVLSRGYHFFMIDLDMTWNNDHALHHILKTKSDISHQCDTPAKFSINSGFYLARSNDRTVQFFKNLMVFRPTENSDQTAMKLFSRYDGTHMASNECLDKWRFNMRCNYKVDKSVKVKGGVETFEWKPFDRDRSKFSWTILHATCLSGAKNKIVWLRTMNAWFLDELDKETGNSGGEDGSSKDDDKNTSAGKGEFCLLLDIPGSEKAAMQQELLLPRGDAKYQTKHSQYYSPTATDQLYLKSRN